jgi:hypothetical protein
LDALKNLNNVIGVDGGRHKVDAIRSVLKGHYLDVLITDEETAEHPHCFVKVMGVRFMVERMYKK